MIRCGLKAQFRQEIALCAKNVKMCHLCRMKFKPFKWPVWLHTFQPKMLFQAVEKITYTTIGILLALWINHCDEDRKKLEIERKTLKEIRAGLEQDRVDLLETIDGYSLRVVTTQNIFDYLNRDSIPADSLSMAISSLMSYSYLLANTAAYETLKSRGLEIITNDSLRLGIATLYDVYYESIQLTEKHLDDLYSTQLLPYLVNNLRLGGKRFTPEEVDKIRKDRPFQQILWQIMANNDYARDRYKLALGELEKLRAKIEIELNSGRF